MASTGLKKWFKEKWVDIGRPKKKGRYQPCGRGKAKTSRKGYPKCVPLARARTMSKAQKRSAVRRKRKVAQGVGGKPTNVRTYTKRGKKRKTPRSKRLLTRFGNFWAYISASVAPQLPPKTIQSDISKFSRINSISSTRSQVVLFLIEACGLERPHPR